ncbi:unnamed protein product [Cunninghamella blakesleeana]
MIETPSAIKETNINDLRVLPAALTKHQKGDRILLLLMDDLQEIYGYDENIQNQQTLSSSTLPQPQSSSKEHILWRFRIVIISLIIISILIVTVIVNELTNPRVITHKSI